MSALLPPPGTRGIYSLKAPFTTEPATLYTAGAIRGFTDIENNGGNVYELYYEPYQLTTADYTRDRNNGEYIVTLLSATLAPLYVPSSYIASFPNLASQPYSHVVMSASMAMLPDALDLTFAKGAMASVLSDILGVTVKVQIASAPYTGVITPEQHEVLEVARQAAIRNRTTDYSKVVAQNATIDSLTQRLRILEQLCKDKGVLPA
jgi:hypothetical protein